MNKSILPLLVTIMILALVGCSHHSDVAPSTNDGQEKGTTSALQTIGEAAETYSGFESASQPIVAGTYYTRNALVDQQLGVDVFSAFLPAGWTGSVASDWTITSADSPGLETITLVAPDNQAQITISSRQDFVQHPLGDEGSSFENYTNYLNYMDADGFTDAYIRLAYGTEATLLTELPDDEATLDQLRQYANTLVDRANATGEALTAGGTIGNISMTDEFYDATMCRRQYVAAGDYLETTATDIAHTQTINNPVLTESYLHWSIPFSIIYKASDQDAFERYYDQYQMIVANSWFTPNYFAAEEYVASRIGANIMDAKALASTGVSFFSKSGYESQNGVSDNEKYINMWDDVINEVDAYRTLDGDIVKTPTYNDVVAQSGDEFFVGPSTADVPDGFTELTKGY